MSFDPTNPIHRQHLADALKDRHQWDLTDVAAALGCEPTNESVGAALVAFEAARPTVTPRERAEWREDAQDAVDNGDSWQRLRGRRMLTLLAVLDDVLPITAAAEAAKRTGAPVEVAGVRIERALEVTRG